MAAPIPLVRVADVRTVMRTVALAERAPIVRRLVRRLGRRRHVGEQLAAPRDVAVARVDGDPPAVAAGDDGDADAAAWTRGGDGDDAVP